jgi:hypothetical protein
MVRSDLEIFFLQRDTTFSRTVVQIVVFIFFHSTLWRRSWLAKFEKSKKSREAGNDHNSLDDKNIFFEFYASSCAKRKNQVDFAFRLGKLDGISEEKKQW